MYLRGMEAGHAPHDGYYSGVREDYSDIIQRLNQQMKGLHIFAKRG